MEYHLLKPLFYNDGMYLKCGYYETKQNKITHPQDNAHIHNYFELYLNVGGDVSFAVENKKFDIKPGDLILTHNNEFHYCIYNSNSTHKFFCLWLSADENYIHLLEPFENCIRVNGNHIRLLSKYRQRFTQILTNIAHSYNEETTVSFATLSDVINLLNSLDEIKAEPEGVDVNALPQMLTEILRYIDLNFMKECTVQSITNRFYISRSTLNRLFSENLYTTPNKYILNRRLSNAKKLLNNGKSVQETYELCGFCDYSHFIQVFKKRFGITPLKYSKVDVAEPIDAVSYGI